MEGGLISDSLINPRLAFIRKVYGIIGCQLLLTAFICWVSMYSDSFLAW
jgi:FtsH-binding integral membrane protein